MMRINDLCMDMFLGFPGVAGVVGKVGHFAGWMSLARHWACEFCETRMEE